MQENKISVIMSTYKEKAEWIQAAILSVLNQTYQNFEFIIVLDNPSDTIISKIVSFYGDKDSRIKVLKNEKNIGLTKSLNKAIQYSTGDIIARMDADDKAMPRRFERQLKYMLENDLDIVGSNVQIIDEEDHVIKNVLRMQENSKMISEKLKFTNCLAHPTWLVRKKVYNQLRGYRDMPMCEDYDFLIRADRQGFKLGNIPEVLLSYRMTNGSISRTNGLKQYLTSRYLQKNIDRIEKIEIEEVNQYLDQVITIDRSINYAKANGFMVKGISLVEEKKYCRALFYLGRAATASSYFTIKMFRMVLGVRN